MQIPYGSIIDLFNLIICGYCSYRLYRSWQVDKRQLVLLFFSQGYFALIFSYFFFAIPLMVFTNERTILGISFVLAQSFLYIAIAFFAKVTAFFAKVNLTKIVFWMVILVSMIAVFLNIVYFNYPLFDTETGLTDWNIHPVVGIASTIIFVGVLAPSAFLFFTQGLRSKDRIVRTRSIIISIGLVSLIITSFLYYTASTLAVSLISDLFSMFSFLIIYIGVIYKRRALNFSTSNN